MTARGEPMVIRQPPPRALRPSDPLDEIDLPERILTTARLVVMPRPLSAWDYGGPKQGRPVAILAWVGRGTDGTEALVIDEWGNVEWVDPSGIAVRDPLIRAAIEDARRVEAEA